MFPLLFFLDVYYFMGRDYHSKLSDNTTLCTFAAVKNICFESEPTGNATNQVAACNQTVAENKNLYFRLILFCKNSQFLRAIFVHIFKKKMQLNKYFSIPNRPMSGQASRASRHVYESLYRNVVRTIDQVASMRKHGWKIRVNFV